MRRALRAASAALALVAWAGTAQAEDPCRATLVASATLGDESGIGGTGLEGESGIGGTGRGDDEGSGIGGTGFEGDDLHLYGTLNAFGSLCVNGVRVLHAPDVEVQVAGRTGGVGDLAVGQVLWIEAERRDGGVHARRVRVVHALTGLPEQIDRERREFRLLGTRVVMAPSVAYGKDLVLAEDRPIAVSGLWQADDRVVATRIVAAPSAAARVGPRLPELLGAAEPGARLSLEGYVARADRADRLRIDGLTLETPERPDVRRPAIGARVRAFGGLTADRLLRIAPPRPAPPERPAPIDRIAPPETPPDVERPPSLDRPPVLEKPPTIDRVETPPRVTVPR